MKSISKEVIYEIVINKSTFINYLIPVSDVDDANDNLKRLRQKYPDANHHCFAYIIGKNREVQKYSDDGEPSKTAGLPMIEVLKKHDLTNVLNVSIRYFGGIKLGAGGLVRAYTKGCAESVKEAEFTTLQKYLELKISIDFDQIGVVEKFIRDEYNLLDTTYDNKVHYIVDMNEKLYDNFVLNIQEKTNGKGTVNILKEEERYN